MLDTTRWWYKRGVAGFRLDAVDTLFEDPACTTILSFPGRTRRAIPTCKQIQHELSRGAHELQKLRKVATNRDAVLIGETWTSDAARTRSLLRQNGNELQMPMDFMFTMVNKLSPAEFRRQIAAVDERARLAGFVISNHDIVRSYNRYGDGKHNDQIAKLMAAFYLTLRGTPIMYYGEEIGMRE
jgi:alpha-glucosidase